MAFTLKINGSPHEVDVDGDTPLLWVLRDVLGMTGRVDGPLGQHRIIIAPSINNFLVKMRRMALRSV